VHAKSSFSQKNIVLLPALSTASPKSKPLESGNLLQPFQLGSQTNVVVRGQVMWVNWTPLSLTHARMAHGGLFLSRQVAMVGQIFGTRFPGQFVSIPRHYLSIP
jgi:hypothetical protein